MMTIRELIDITARRLIVLTWATATAWVLVFPADWMRLPAWAVIGFGGGW